MRGVSLTEILVALAMIAVVAFITVPSYWEFRAVARQNEGKTLLGGYYQAAHWARVEFKFYPGNFVATGFQPTTPAIVAVIAPDLKPGKRPLWEPLEAL